MKNRIKHKKFVIGLAVVALTAASILWSGGSLQTVAASGQDGSVRFVSYACVGIIPDEMLRVSVANTANLTGLRQATFKMFVADYCGTPLYESESILVPAGGFAGRDILIGGLPANGEPRTGRVQMSVKIVIEAPSGSKPADFPVSLEIIKQETGATSVPVPTGRVTFIVN